jgi:cell division septum initiation protein DivIVA
MSRQNSSNIEPDQNKHSTSIEPLSSSSGDIDIQQELNRLEEMVLASPHIPLTRRTLVDEEQLLEQLDLVRLHLPKAFQEAQAIVQQKKEIILQAEQNAQRILQAAQVRAAQLLNEMDIIQLAELEAKQIRQQVQQECEAAQEQNQAEIDQIRFQAQQELEEMRLAAIAEAEEIQTGADEYADSVLKNIEQQLHDMLRIIRNGRQQLQQETSPNHNSSSDSTRI